MTGLFCTKIKIKSCENDPKLCNSIYTHNGHNNIGDTRWQEKSAFFVSQCFFRFYSRELYSAQGVGHSWPYLFAVKRVSPNTREYTAAVGGLTGLGYSRVTHITHVFHFNLLLSVTFLLNVNPLILACLKERKKIQNYFPLHVQDTQDLVRAWI